MKKSIKSIGLCLIVISVNINVAAQETQATESVVLKKRIYKASIITFQSKKSTGYLAGLSDSNLYLSQYPVYFSLIKTDDNLSVYPYGHLERIEVKRKAAGGRGAWQGALIGLATGAIIGFASGDDPVAPTDNPNDPFGNLLGGISNAFSMTAGQKAVLGGFIGALTGSITGAIIGSLIKKKFLIGRNKERFHEMHRNIVNKLYVHSQENLQPRE